jgi:hypothetical protein
MPWFIEPAYLLHMVEMSVVVVALLTIAGLVYSVLFHLLSNHTGHRSIQTDSTESYEYIVDSGTKFGWSLMHNTTFTEEQHNEA